MTSLETLKQSVSGIVIVREAAGTAAITTAPERFPEAIVGATSVADVQAAVRFAHRHGLKVTARGAGLGRFDAPVEGGIVIDLSALNHVKIDPVARMATTGPVVTQKALSHALGPHGLACVNVECVDVVTAEGELIRASLSEHPEIYRAARTSGAGFFGIIVGYQLRLQRLPCAAPSNVRVLAPVRWTPRVPASFAGSEVRQ